MKKESATIIFPARTLERQDLPRVDAHLHTSWTDGQPSVHDVYVWAAREGFSAILFSEHCRKTSVDWFPQFVAEVRALPGQPCLALVGAEVKVETVDGEIDTVPEIASLCDVIMASVHRFPDKFDKAIPFAEIDAAEAVEREFSLTWAVLTNPQVDIIGHLFGMSYRRFSATPPPEKVRALIERAAKHGVAVEINAHYHSDPWQLFDWCCEFDALITFGSNAHDLEHIGATRRLLERLNAD